MTEASDLVRVQFRHVVLHAGAPLRTVAGRSFLQLDNPPPVRTVVRLLGSGGDRAARVERVLEVEADETGKARGCFVALVDEGALRVHDEVGSEALEPGRGQPSPPAAVSDAAASATEAGDTAAGEDAAETAPEQESPEGSGDDEGDDEPMQAGASSSGGKRRKGRRRR